ncbi:MAG: hypothetical protein WD491_03760 [Balneolales bacterium]
MVKQYWTEDYYYKKKLLSNCQKVTFSIGREDIITENNTIRIGVRSMLHGHLANHQNREYNTAHPFSLAISITDNRKANKQIEKLYDELVAVNTLDVLGDVDINLEV